MKTIDVDKRLNYCNFTKTILMLIVCFYHSILFLTGDWFGGTPVFSSPFLKVLAEWLNTFHIYGFTLVSGYIYYYLKCEKGKYDDFRGFVKNKTQRLLVPYVFVCVVWVIPITVCCSKIGIKDVFEKYVLGISPSQLWFLLMLFNVFVISYFLTQFWEKHFVLGLFATFMLYGAGIIGASIMPNIYMIFTSLQYVLFFWIGFNLRKYADCILWKVPPLAYLIVHILLFCGMGFFRGNEGIIFKLINLCCNIALNIIGSVMAFMILQSIARRIKSNNKFFEFIGERSMPIYLFHQQIIYFTIMLFDGILNPWIHSLVNFFVAIILSVIISSVLKKFKLTSALIGEK